MRALPLAFLLSFHLLPGPANPVVSPWSEHEPVSVRLVAPYRTAPEQGTLWLGFDVRLDEGWHIYWKNSGDAGYPPVMEIEATPALEGAELLFPAPRRFPVAGGLLAIGYEERVIYPIRARLPPSGAETLDVTGSFDYLVCEEDCIPFHDELSLRLPLGESDPDPEIESRLEAWKARLPRPIDELPQVRTRLALAGEELVLDVVIPADTTPANEVTGTPELFLEPVQGVELGEPRAESGPTGLRFRVPVSPRDAEAGLPHGSRVSYVLTGLRGEKSLPAVEATDRLPAPDAETAPPGPQGVTTPDLLREGLLLGLSPSVLALLGLLVLLTHRQLRDELGELSEVWPFPAGAFAGFLTLCLGLRLWHLGGLPTPFATPWVVVAGTLPTLGLTLWLWLGHPSRVRNPRSMTRDLGSGFLAPLLALPWVPAASSLAPLASGRGTVADGATAAAGFAVPFLVTGAVVTWLGGRETPGKRPRWEDALGFLASTTLIWVSYRLLDLLPTDRVAFVQLAWLGTGLSAHLGTVSKRSRAAWLALTVILGGVSVLVALS